MSLVTELHNLWTDRLTNFQTRSELIERGEISTEDEREIRAAVDKGFWILPNERAFNCVYAGCAVPAAEHVDAHRPWPEDDDNDEQPTTTVIAYSNQGQAQPAHCDWCRDSIQRVRPSPDGVEYNLPSVAERERNKGHKREHERQLERLASRPTALCPFHRHHVLTGERLTPEQVHRLEQVRQRLRRWTWAHALCFVGARAEWLPSSHVEEHGAARVLYSSGSSHLNDVLWARPAPWMTALHLNNYPRLVPFPAPAPSLVVVGPPVRPHIRCRHLPRRVVEGKKNAVGEEEEEEEAAMLAAQRHYHRTLSDRLLGQVFEYHHAAIMQQRQQPASFEHAVAMEWLLVSHRGLVARQKRRW